MDPLDRCAAWLSIPQVGAAYVFVVLSCVGLVLSLWDHADAAFVLTMAGTVFIGGIPVGFALAFLHVLNE